jgi:hypothetical protein
MGIQPIGFFFSQFWHVIMNIIRLNMCPSQKKHFRPSSYHFAEILEKDDINHNKYNMEKLDDDKLLKIRDYFYHYYLLLNKNEKVDLNHIYSFLSRRWDLINTIGNGVLSYIIGSCIGFILFNTIKERDIIIQTFNATVKLYYDNSTQFTKTGIDKLIINQFPIIYSDYYFIVLNIVSILFLIISYIGIKWINSERQSMLLNIFYKLNVSPEKIIEAFPELKKNIDS